MKFLIDECLSEELATLARRCGHVESSHVRWLGKGGATDWQLMPLILDGDWTFVTTNAIDFRGSGNLVGRRGQYRMADIHAGLVCLNSATGMDLALQLELYQIALEELGGDGDLINHVLEVSLNEADEIVVERYSFPLPD